MSPRPVDWKGGGAHFLLQLVCIGDVLGELGKITEEKFGRSHDRATDRTIVLVQLFFHR